MESQVPPRTNEVNKLKNRTRTWMATTRFGPPAIFQLDDHCDNRVQLEIGPGQAHTRLGIVARCHHRSSADGWDQLGTR